MAFAGLRVWLNGYAELCCGKGPAEEGREALRRGALARELARQQNGLIGRESRRFHRASTALLAPQDLSAFADAATRPGPAPERRSVSAQASPEELEAALRAAAGAAAEAAASSVVVRFAACSTDKQEEEASDSEEYLVDGVRQEISVRSARSAWSMRFRQTPSEANVGGPSAPMTAVSSVRSTATARSISRIRSRSFQQSERIEGVGDAPSSLLQACRDGDVDMVKTLLSGPWKDQCLKEVDDEGVTPLITAAALGTEEIVEQLLDHAVDVNQADQDGVTALQAGAYDGHIKIVRRLIQARAEVDKADHDGCTPLYLAAANGGASDSHLQVVQELVNAEADPNFAAGDGSSPLIVAETPEIVEILRAGPRHRETRRKKRIHKTSDETHSKHLHSAGSMMLGMLELANAGKRRHQPEEDEDDETGDNAFHAATKHGKVELVACLCKSMVRNINKLNAQDNTALHIAAEMGRADVAAALLDGGADKEIVDADGKTALHLAAARGYLEVVTVLCARHADPDAPDDKGDTALILASANGYAIIAKALVHARADIGGTTKTGRTALHVAATKGHESVVRYLVDARAAVRAQDVNGLTPLEVIAAMPHPSRAVLEVLQAAGEQDEGQGARFVSGVLKTRPSRQERGSLMVPTASTRKRWAVPSAPAGAAAAG